MCACVCWCRCVECNDHDDDETDDGDDSEDEAMMVALCRGMYNISLIYASPGYYCGSGFGV